MITKIQKKFGVTRTGAKGVIIASFSSILMQLSSLAPVAIVMFFIQKFIEQEIPSAGFFGIAIAIMAVVMYLLIHINYNHLYNETYKESKNLRIEIANRLKELPLSYFSQHDISDLSQTIMADVAEIEHALSHSVPQIVSIFFTLSIIGIMMFIFQPILAACVFVPIVLSLLLILLSKKFQVKGVTKHYWAQRDRSEAFQQAIEMQQEIRSYALSDTVSNQLFDLIKKIEKVHIRAEIKQAAPMNIATGILRFSIGLTLFFGLQLFVHGQTSLLFLMGYLIAAARIGDLVSSLEMSIEELFYFGTRMKRINELREIPIQKGEKKEISSFDIEFKEVEFSYLPDQKVIDKLSFIAKQNEVTALVGPSGCGKTSVLRLASRLFDYDKGKILIGGEDIQSIDTDTLFDKISIVFQDVTLFNATVLENIRIGNRNASDEEVMQAAKLANCAEFIESLPEKYHTVIGENGSLLSGGERQRISIARAFLKNAPIIILDEISASLDVENEMKIQESLNKLIKGKTVIIISHRLKSIEKADKIVVLKEGKLEAEGKHEVLLQKSKLYKSMIEKSMLTEKWEY